MALATGARVIPVPPGYSRRTRFYQEISESSEPALELHPAHYLPTLAVERLRNLPYVMYAGTIVANSTMAGQGQYLTFANGGTAVTYTYTASDVYSATDVDTFQVEDIDSLGSVVTTAGAAATPDAVNLPIGYAQHNFYSDVQRIRNNNFFIQDAVTITCDKFIEIPLQTADQTTGARAVVSGCLIAPMAGALGVSVRFRHGTDSVDQIIGRCVRVETVAARGGLDRVFTTKGLNLPGVDTSGVPSHLDITGVTTSAKINVTLA